MHESGTSAARPVPTLVTARLTLAAHRPEDFDDYVQVWGDPAVTRFIGGRPFSPEETWTRMLRYAGLWALLGYGYWAVRETASGRYVGDVGFADYRRAITPSIAGTPEIGWVLAAWCHGLGYATEAAEAALRWSDATLPDRETLCIIVPDHTRSIRVAEKVGFRASGPSIYHDKPMTILRRPADRNRQHE